MSKLQQLANQIKQLPQSEKAKLFDQLSENYVGYAGVPSKEFLQFHIVKEAISQSFRCNFAV